MGSKICCTGGAPPSPDGVAPRLALGPSPSKLHPPRTFVASLDTAVSPLSNPNDTADLQAIFEDAKLSTNDGVLRMKPKKNVTVVQAVTDRLKKRLSRDMGVAGSTKRSSRSGVSGSEEEIGRRAELRRIRQKRIEDELSNDIYDDDAKSLSIVPGGNSTVGGANRATWSGEYLPSPSLTPPTLTFPGVSQSYFDSPLVIPTYAVHDKIKPGGETSSPSRKDSDLSTSSRLPSAAIRPENGHKRSEELIVVKNPRRHSFPVMLVDKTAFEPCIDHAESKNSNKALVSTRSIWQAMCRPSIHDPALNSSWRISVTDPNHGEHPRKLSRRYVEPSLSKMESRKAIISQPLNKWLHSQDIHTSSQLLSNSDASSNPDCVSPTYSCNEQLGKVDGSRGLVSTVHLYDMAISQRLAPSGINSISSTKPLSDTGSRAHHRPESKNAFSNTSETNIARCSHHSSSSTTRGCLPDSWGSFLEEEVSTFKSSAANSAQPSSHIPDLDVLKIASQFKKKNVELSISEIFSCPNGTLNVKETTKLCAIESPSSLPSAPNSSTLHLDNLLPLTVTPARRHSHFTADSSGITETDSHHQLEAELQDMQTRFAGSASRVHKPVPVSSKFHEEFGLEIEVDTTNSLPMSRQSISALTDRIKILTIDGTMEKLLGVPLPPTSNISNRRTSITAMNNPVEDSALGVWGRAVKEVRKEDNAEVGRKKSIFTHNLKRATSARRVGSKTRLTDGDKNMKRDSYDTLMAKKEDVMGDWEREMEETAKRAKIKTKKAVERAAPQAKFGRGGRYPTSWSNYPSFNRRERTDQSRSGRSLDSIERRDFAVHSTNGEDTIWYRNEQSRHPHHHDDDNCPPQDSKGLFKKLEVMFRSHTPQSAIKDAELVFDQTFGRKGSVIQSLPLEFPELEILAIEDANLMTDDQIEEHVERLNNQKEAQKKEEDLQRKQEELDIIFGGPRRAGKESAISKARKAAELQQAKQAEEASRKRKKVDQFGMELGRPSGPWSRIETAPGPRSSRKEKRLLEIPKKAAFEPVEPEPFEETLDMAGMNRAVLEQQIADRAALKKKIEERKRVGRGVRRGPVARFNQELAIQEPVHPKTAIQRSTGLDASDSAISERPISAMGGDESDLEDVLIENNIEHDSGTGLSPISIADPRYYKDCVVGGAPNTPSDGQKRKLSIDNVMMHLESLKLQSSHDGRFRNSHSVARYRYGCIRLVKSVGDIDSMKIKGAAKYQQPVFTEISDYEYP